MVNVGLIGITGYGRMHLDCLQEAQADGRCRLTAAAVINADEIPDQVAALEAAGTRIFPDYREMLAEQGSALDLVCIPTAIDWHREMTIDALQAGAHVLVEKPAAPSLKDLDAMRAAEKASGRFVEVGFQDIFDPGNAWVKDQILDGVIGPLKRIRCYGIWPRESRYYQRNRWAGAIRSQRGLVLDSPVSNAFAHFINLMLYFSGPEPARPASIAELEANLFRAQKIENFDTASLRIRTGDGAELLFHVTHSARHEEHESPNIRIEGENGHIEWVHESAARIFDRNGSLIGERELLTHMPLREQMFAHVLQRTAEPGLPAGCSLSLARSHTELVERLHREFSITDVPADWIEVVPVNENSTLTCIRGVGDWLRRAHCEGVLLERCSPFGPK